MTREARYSDFLAFVLDGGHRLSDAVPRLAGHLRERSLDPDVERLVEGLACLASQVDARVDDRTTLLYELAFDTLFPGFLTAVPAATVVELHAPRYRTIPAGAELRSIPVEGTTCRFRTVYEVDASPIRVKEARFIPGRGRAELHLGFEEAQFPAEHPDRLRLFLSGDLGATASLYQWLRAALVGVELKNEQGVSLGEAKEIRVRPVGFEPGQELLPDQGSSDRMSLLKEYFLLPQKLLFLDLAGAVSATRRLGITGGRFGMVLHLGVEAARALPVSAETIRLGATPAVNLFEHFIDPVVKQPWERDVWLRPYGLLGHFDVHEVREIRGLHGKDADRYAIAAKMDARPGERQRVAQLYRSRSGRHGQTRTYAHLDRDPPLNTEEVIVADILASNGHLAKMLRPGDLNTPESAFQGVRCHNILGFAGPIAPPSGEDVRRALVAHLALATRGLASTEALRDAVELYHFAALEGGAAGREQELLVEAIQSLKSVPTILRLDGDPVLGKRHELVIDESAFATEGELYLFGCVLDEILAADTDLNVVSELRLSALKQGKVLVWPKRAGPRQILI